MACTRAVGRWYAETDVAERLQLFPLGDPANRIIVSDELYDDLRQGLKCGPTSRSRRASRRLVVQADAWYADWRFNPFQEAGCGGRRASRWATLEQPSQIGLKKRRHDA